MSTSGCWQTSSSRSMNSAPNSDANARPLSGAMSVQARNGKPSVAYTRACSRAIAPVPMRPIRMERLLRKRPALGFRRKWQRGKADEEHEAHRDARVAHRLGIADEDAAGEQPERERPNRRDEAADVVAERSARATEARGKQLRQIDRVPAEQRELARAHDRDHPEDVAEVVQVPERE